MPEGRTTTHGRAIGIVAIVVPVVAVAIAVSVGMLSDGGTTPGDAARAVAEVAPIDPKLLTYAEARAIDTGLAAPRAIAIDAAGRLYVAGAGGVVRMNDSGGDRARIDLDAAATCLAVTDDGLLIVGERKRILVRDTKGGAVAEWPVPGKRAFVTSVDVRGGEILVGDAGSRVVLRFDRAGTLLARIGEADPSRGIDGLNIPSPYMDAAYAPDGTVWVADTGRHRVESYTKDGEITGYFGEPGAAIGRFCGCCNPSHFAIMPDGRLVTSEKGSPRTKIFSADGELEEVVAMPDAFTPNVLGLDTAVDASGRVFILDPPAKRVRVFERKAGRRATPD